MARPKSPNTGSTPDASLRRAVPINLPVHELAAQLTLAPTKYPRSIGMMVQGEAKYVTWTFPASLKTVELVQLTDVQWGHICCKVERVIEYRDWILDAPNRFMIWTGDMIDAAHVLSAGTPWENTGTPQSQMFEFCRVWARARHRVLGYVGGNHERRTVSFYGDLGITIAALLRVPYSRGKQIIDIHFGAWTPFKVSQWHGAGAARTKGTVAQTLSRFASDGDANLYLMGHLHQPMIIPLWKERYGPNGTILAVKAFAALGSSFLETWGSYGEVAGYSPTDVMMPRAVLDAKGGFELTLR